ncbi:MAG: hypothetical protein ABFD79_03640 [Phycisphaerales bacterium]
MTGGQIDISGWLTIPQSGGSGTVYLDGGTIYAHRVGLYTGGLIDIRGGILDNRW